MSTNSPNDPFSREGAESLAHTVRQAQRAMEEHPLSAVHINQGSADAMADAYDAEYQASRTMATPPNAPEVDVLAVILRHAEMREASGKPNLALELFSAVREIQSLLTREAALVARNAELEKQLCETTQIANAVIIERNSFRDACLQRVAERDAWKRQAEHGETVAAALAAEVGALREALSRQGDNMAFVLNNCDIPEVWCAKLNDELTEDRATVARTSAARAEAGHGLPPVG